MNDRKRQIKKVLRMYARNAKKSNDLLLPNKIMDCVSDAIRKFGEAAVKCANTLSEWLNNERVQTLLRGMGIMNEEVNE